MIKRCNKEKKYSFIEHQILSLIIIVCISNFTASDFCNLAFSFLCVHCSNLAIVERHLTTVMCAPTCTGSRSENYVHIVQTLLLVTSLSEALPEAISRPFKYAHVQTKTARLQIFAVYY